MLLGVKSEFTVPPYGPSLLYYQPGKDNGIPFFLLIKLMIGYTVWLAICMVGGQNPLCSLAPS